MKHILVLLGFAVFGSITFAPRPVLAAEHTERKAAAGASELASAVDVTMAMRKLWEDHITYTRNYIISTLADLPDGEAVAKRLLKNQDDIGDAIKPYYGDEPGKKVAALLRDHILIATE